MPTSNPYDYDDELFIPESNPDLPEGEDYPKDDDEEFNRPEKGRGMPWQ